MPVDRSSLVDHFLIDHFVKISTIYIYIYIFFARVFNPQEGSIYIYIYIYTHLLRVEHSGEELTAATCVMQRSSNELSTPVSSSLNEKLIHNAL